MPVPAADAGYRSQPGFSVWLQVDASGSGDDGGGRDERDNVQGERGLGERWRSAGGFYRSAGGGAAVEHGAGVLAWKRLRDEDIREPAGAQRGEPVSVLEDREQRYFVRERSHPREDDDMVYEIFIRNKSGTKTWWDVTVWDTVPDELDSCWTDSASMTTASVSR